MGKNSPNNPNSKNNSNQKTQQPPAAPLSLKDIEKLLDKQSADLKQTFDGKFKDHEDRLKKLETAVFPQNTSGGSSAANSAATPTTASTSAPDPATTTMSNPTAAPAPAPAPAAAPTQTQQSSASQPVMQGEMPYNGPGHAYKYWDYSTGTWCFKLSIWAAKQASNGVYTPVWVWYKNGVMHHVLSNEEIAKYTP